MASKLFGKPVVLTTTPQSLTVLLGLDKPGTFVTASLRAGDETEQASKVYFAVAVAAGNRIGYLRPGDAISIEVPGAIPTDSFFLEGEVGGEVVYVGLVEH